MKHTFIQKIVFLLVLFFSSVVLSHGTVIITNVEHDEGYIDVKIYDSKESFLKEDEAVEVVRKKVKKGRVLILQKCENFWCKIKTEKFKGWIKINNIWGAVN